MTWKKHRNLLVLLDLSTKLQLVGTGYPKTQNSFAEISCTLFAQFLALNVLSNLINVWSIFPTPRVINRWYLSQKPFWKKFFLVLDSESLSVLILRHPVVTYVSIQVLFLYNFIFWQNWDQRSPGDCVWDYEISLITRLLLRFESSCEAEKGSFISMF